ncbi:DUF3093 domain-containing protein [Rhodococcus sp. NPDC003382]|uniref:DUF3093 domain-containing protein n=1 Tax=unclassified Rhodococcus (in: high G+C Gram-positive bacteria) TaxID=192944 RepID=UPI00200A59A5|nr:MULTISPECIES: DUF3093 domain-containing protein [unclassified Rhodococcus (in: high G+C Gram-positive bacteria)]MCK8673076.1 DUF3093 domain-containing protein [Rhodococcus sp. HM1]
MSESSRPGAAARSATGSPAYSERLWVPLWWWPLGFGVAALLAAELNMAARALPDWLPYVVLLIVPVWILWWLSRKEIRVVGGELVVDRAHLPIDVIARGVVVPASAKSAAMGRQLDPAAYVSHRPWVGTMALVVLNDPDDPTPYWLVSTRRPAELLAALGCADTSKS